MQINPTVKARTVTQGNMLIKNKSILPDGRYLFSGPLIGNLRNSTVIFVDSSDKALHSIAQAPKTIFEIDNRPDAQSPFPATPPAIEDEQTSNLVTPERVDIARKDIVDEVKKGVAGIALTHVVQKGGAAVATPLVTNVLGISNDPAAATAISSVISGAEVAKHAQILGNFLKLIIFAGSCFGITLKLLRLFFDDTVPRWAWITSILINIVLTVVAGLYLFDIGPFAPGP